MKRFEATRALKNKELAKVVNFLIDSVGLKTHKGILMQRSNIKYFRGVNFHIAVLQASSEILKMIPSLVKDGEVTQLKSI